MTGKMATSAMQPPIGTRNSTNGFPQGLMGLGGSFPYNAPTGPATDRHDVSATTSQMAPIGRYLASRHENESQNNASTPQNAPRVDRSSSYGSMVNALRTPHRTPNQQRSRASENLRLNTDVKSSPQSTEGSTAARSAPPVDIRNPQAEGPPVFPLARHLSFYGQIYGGTDRSETPGGVKLPSLPTNTITNGVHGRYNSQASSEQSASNHTHRSGSSDPFDTSVTPRPMMTQFIGPGPVVRSQEPLGSSQQTDDPDERQRASNLAAFIKSGRAEEPLLKATAIPTGPAASRSRPAQSSAAPYVIPQLAPPAPFTARVQAERIPHMDNSHDPIATGLVQMISQGHATEDMLLHHLPVWDAAMQTTNPSTAGVVQITDIPYDTTRQEVVAFFGRNARLLTQPAKSPFYAIHIIMERTSAKSMDCYVEFEDTAEAVEALRRLHRCYQAAGRKARIGDRIVSVRLSSQQELMRAVFPRAKCMRWEGQNPVVSPAGAAGNPYSLGFKGYVTSEEMHMVAKFATTPGRSRFAGKHPQRAYESMITLLNKYPWWSAGTWTMGERDSIFNCTRDQIEHLSRVVVARENPQKLDSALLEELLCAGLSCPGFTDSQRSSLQLASQDLVGHPRYVSPTSSMLPFNALQRRHHLSEQVLELFVHYLQTIFANDYPMERMNFNDPFCYIRRRIETPPQNATFAQVSQLERALLQEAVAKIVEHGANLPIPAHHIGMAF